MRRFHMFVSPDKRGNIWSQGFVFNGGKKKREYKRERTKDVRREHLSFTAPETKALFARRNITVILILGIPFLLSLFFFPFRVFLLLLLLCAGLDLLSSTYLFWHF